MDFMSLFDEARKYPHAQVSAARVNGENCTVASVQILDEAEKLADRLTASGLKEGMQIGLQAPNCYEYLVWDLAAIRVGAILHTVPEDLPAKNVVAIAKKHHVALWLYEKARSFEGLTNGIDLADTLLATSFPVDHQAPSLDDDDLHSRVYSSGSSGYLKGLNISQRGTAMLVSDFIADFGLCDADSHLIFLPLSNYQQRLSVYGCLWTGASIKVIHHTTVFQDMSRYGPSFIIAPPAIYENIHNLFGRGPDARENLSTFFGGNIRFMITGMAPIRKDILTAFKNHGLTLLEAYGVTETGMIAWNTVREQRIGSVGRLIHPEHVHFTAESEIVIKRPLPLSKGYFDSTEDDSAGTFLPDGSIVTGDVGTLDDDGFLSLSGRKKEIIVTSGGSKFHPEEIERALLSIDAIKHAVVLMSKNDNRLAAVLVAENSDDPGVVCEIDAIIQTLNSSLSSYKRIHRRIITGTQPSVENGMLTRNLKCDRRGVYRYFQAGIEGQGGQQS